MLSAQERNTLLEEGERHCDLAIQLTGEGRETDALEKFEAAERAFSRLQDQRWLNFVLHEKFRHYQRFDKQEKALELTDRIIEGYLATLNRHGLSLILIHKADLSIRIGKTEDGLGHLNSARAVIESEHLSDLEGYLHASLASAFMHIEDYSSAVISWEKALLQYREQSSSEELAWSLLQSGQCHLHLLNFATAEEQLRAAYRMFQKLGDQENELQAAEQLKKIRKNR